MQTNSDGRIFNFICPLCQKGYQYRSWLLIHLDRTHTARKEEILPLISQTPPAKRRRGKLTWEEVIKLYETHSTTEIAKLDGTSAVTISLALHRKGVKLRPVGTGEGHLKPPLFKHGFYRRNLVPDLIPGADPFRQLRFLTVQHLGGICVKCGITDYRVLQINHINGQKLPEKIKGVRTPKGTTKQCLRILENDPEILPHVEVRCANCNILHEYERGKIKELCITPK